MLAFLSTLKSPEDDLTAENFIYWLNGYFEISNSDKLSKEQVQIIRDHLKLCLNKVTPNRTILNDLKPMSVQYPPLMTDDILVYSSPPASC